MTTLARKLTARFLGGSKSVVGKQHQISIHNIPSVIMEEIFAFLDIIDYLCNVTLVCKEWTIKNTEDMINKTYLIRSLIYNTCKESLYYIRGVKGITQDFHYPVSEYDLIHEYELSAAYTAMTYDSLYIASETQSALFKTAYDSMCNQFTLPVPTYPLYFDLDIKTRKIKSFKYLFHYIYLLQFGKKDISNLYKLFVLIINLLFNGGTLCVGWMLHSLFRKHVQILDDLTFAFWQSVNSIFMMYFKNYTIYMKDKQIWVGIQNFYHLIRTSITMTECHEGMFGIDDRIWVLWDQLNRQNDSHALCTIMRKHFVR